MAYSWSNRFQPFQSPVGADFASHARENAEYLYYCSQWWWNMFLSQRAQSSQTCECCELQYPPQDNNSCECSELQYPPQENNSCECCLGDTYLEAGGLEPPYYRSSCCGDSNKNLSPRVHNRHCDDYDNYAGHFQSREVPVSGWTDSHRYHDRSTDYTNVDNEGYQGGQEGDMESEEMEMEVNEDFRKFLEQSKKYREERDKCR